MKNFFVLWLILHLLVGCKKEDDAPLTDQGHKYFPIQEGSYSTYDYLSVTYDDFFTPVKVDSQRYYKKYVLDSIADSTDFSRFYLSIYRKDSLNQNWKLTDRWFGDKSNSRITLNEENLTLLKMVFPVRSGEEWNGNAFNTMKEENYRYISVNTSENLNGIEYQEVAKIEQRNTVNLIERERSYEWYAPNIGMIYKEEVSIRTAVNGEIESGYEEFYTILEHGRQ